MKKGASIRSLARRERGGASHSRIKQVLTLLPIVEYYPVTKQRNSSSPIPELITVPMPELVQL
jgi:hypothetical protein